MPVKVRVAVAGATGYAGGELVRLLLGHERVEVATLTAGSSAGTVLGEHHPQLWPLRERVIQPTTPVVLADHDVVALALPHGASAELAQQLPDEVMILDCGADFRLRSKEDWQRFYDSPHAGTWPYGLPELPGARDELAAAKRIAVPGCNVTAATLALLPAVADDLINTDDVVITAAVGPSGAGKSAKPHLLGAELMGSITPYGVGGSHRHIPEIQQNLITLGATAPRVSFTPMLVPAARGIVAVCSAPLRDPALDDATARATYLAHYDSEPFVQLLVEGRWPQSQHVIGSNACQVQVGVDRGARRLIMIAAIDNLVKGTAGQAIQCMNLALGWPETTGLQAIAVAP